MCSLEQFKIDLKRLTDEVTTLEFDLDNHFFAALDGSELRQGALHVSVSIRKATGFFELLFHTEGTVTVTCDRCLDDMDQPISTERCQRTKEYSTRRGSSMSLRCWLYPSSMCMHLASATLR